MKVQLVAAGTPDGEAARAIAKEIVRICFSGSMTPNLGVAMGGIAVALACSANVVAKQNPRDWLHQIHEMALLILEQNEHPVSMQ